VVRRGNVKRNVGEENVLWRKKEEGKIRGPNERDAK